MIYLIPDSHIVTETSHDGLLVVDIEQARYVLLDAVGAQIWRTLRQTGDLDAAAARLHKFYDVERPELEADLTEFVEYLVRSGLASYEPWSTASPAEPPLMPSGTAEDLYLDLLTDALLGADASTTRPAEAHLVRIVRELTVEAATTRVEAGAKAGAIVLPESLGHPAVLMAAGVLAAHGRRSWRVHVIPVDDGLPIPPQFEDLGARVRLDRLCHWGWSSELDGTARVPVLVWLPDLADACSVWAALAEQVAAGGIVAAEDVQAGIVRDLLGRPGQQIEDIIPLSWRAGWLRICPHNTDSGQKVESTAEPS